MRFIDNLLKSSLILLGRCNPAQSTDGPLFPVIGREERKIRDEKPKSSGLFQ
jgi:hypothetical protein